MYVRVGLCCVRREGSGMGVVVLDAMRRGVGTLGVFASGYLLVVGTPTVLGRFTCVERELLILQRWH